MTDFEQQVAGALDRWLQPMAGTPGWPGLSDSVRNVVTARLAPRVTAAIEAGIAASAASCATLLTDEIPDDEMAKMDAKIAKMMAIDSAGCWAALAALRGVGQ